MKLRRWWGRCKCLLFGHLYGEWIELDVSLPSPKQFMRQCVQCLDLQYGKRSVHSSVYPTGRAL